MFSSICDNWYPKIDKNQKTLEGLRVLVVDDNDDSLELVKLILEEYEMRVTTATSASEAFEAITQSARSANAQVLPDVVISDIAMPLVDGYELIRQIRSLPPEQGGLIPAIALSAYIEDEEHTLSLNAGFQKHFTKPVEPDELVAVVAELAGQRHYEVLVA